LLSDPISNFIPAFENMKVYAGKDKLVPAKRKITFHHVLTHTSGFTYGYPELFGCELDPIYREGGVVFEDLLSSQGNYKLPQLMERLAKLPLLFHPGDYWHYGCSVDVCGHLIELISGLPLDEFLAQRIFKPLQMIDTGFSVPANKRARVSKIYTPNTDPNTASKEPLLDITESMTNFNPVFLSGGAGLYSTLNDYYRFAKMILNHGELEHQRILSPKTLEYMLRNHLPGGKDLSQSTFLPDNALNQIIATPGTGFGLGFHVIQNTFTSYLRGVGQVGWNGAAGTGFFVDPQEEIIWLFFTQLLNNPTPPMFTLQPIVYSSIIQLANPQRPKVDIISKL